MPSVGHKLLSGASLRLIFFTTQVSVSFFLTPFIIHSLGDRMYGFWTLVGTFIGYYGVLDFGLTTAVNRYIAGSLGSGDKEETVRVYNTALVLFFAIGCAALLATALIVFFTPMIISNPDEIPLFRIVIIILGINMALEFLVRVFVGTLNAQMYFNVISYIQIGNLFTRSILIVLALQLGYGILAMAWVSLLTGIVTKFLYFVIAKRKLPILKIDFGSINRNTTKKLFSYSAFMLLARVAGLMRFRLAPLIIASSLSLTAVAYYSIASALITYFNQIIGKIMSVFNPLFSQQEARNEQAEIERTLYFATRISVAVSSFIGFGLIAWGHPFIKRWIGGDYLVAYPCLYVMVIGILPFLWQTPAHSYLYATSKHKIIAILNIFEGFANIALSLLLIRYYEILGVAIGMCISLAVSKLIVFPIYFSRLSTISYSAYMGKLSLYVCKCCLAFIIPGGITYSLVAADYGKLLLVGTLSFIFYSSTLWLLLLDKSDRKIFIKSLSSILGRS